MPLSKHYGGSGEKVMRNMRKQYGDRAERIFYATENKMKSEGRLPKKRKMSSRK